MSQETKYRTLSKLSEGLFKEKGSKFIAYAVPCYTEEEAKEYLMKWQKANHQARHVCYAYRFGADKKVFRANDDGEPSNSAGAPILGQIQSYDLTNILIGVVRYFGGTKLGVGGLIHAYRTAAKEAIEEGEIIEKELIEKLNLKFTYSALPSIMSVIKKYALEVFETDFQLECALNVHVPLGQVELIKNDLNAIDTCKIETKGIF